MAGLHWWNWLVRDGQNGRFYSSANTYYYAQAHPAGPTRPELRGAVAETFSRTPNGCGHRQAAMCLRAELGARIADKTVLKMMREMGPAAASAARPTAIGAARTGA